MLSDCNKWRKRNLGTYSELLRALVGRNIAYFFFFMFFFPFFKNIEEGILTERVCKHNCIYEPTVKEHADMRTMKTHWCCQKFFVGRKDHCKISMDLK